MHYVLQHNSGQWFTGNYRRPLVKMIVFARVYDAIAAAQVEQDDAWTDLALPLAVRILTYEDAGQ